MKSYSLITLLLLCFLAMGAHAAGQRFTLVRDGKSACDIIIAENPSDNAKLAAQELQAYVEKISGATLPIYSEADKIEHQDPLVLIGRSRYTDRIANLKIPDGITRDLREEGYIIRATPDTLVLAGNDNFPYYGTRYAVDNLLKRLGVRWFMPGSYGEVVPKATTLQIEAMSISDKPDFPVRSFWAHAEGNMESEREFWMIRNGMNPRSPNWFGVPGDGSINGYLPKDQVKEHPEWFALGADGTRNPDMPCMGDEMRRNDPQYKGQPRILDEIMKKIGMDVQAGKRTSGMAPDDGAPECTCDLCKGLSFRFADTTGANANGDPAPEYATGQEWFFFVDKLLEATWKQFPGHLIATNGYANRTIPPEASATFNQHKNLVVMYADIMGCTIHRDNDPKCWLSQRQYNMIKQWCKLSDKVWMYTYDETMMVRKCTLTPMVHRIRVNIPMIKQAGSIGFSDEDEDDMSSLGLPTYTTRMALEWNTRTDVDALLADYFQKWFGPAAAPMRDFYNTLETSFDTTTAHGHEDVVLQFIYTPKVLQRMEGDILQAEKLAQTDTEKLHVHVERLIFDFLHDYMLENQAKRELRFKDAAQLMVTMQGIKKELHAISPFFGWQPYAVYNTDWEQRRMERVGAKVDGPEGAMLVGMPEVACFRTDKHNNGVYSRWMEPTFNDAKWQRCSTTLGWQNQGLKDDDGLPLLSKDGHAYQGFGWYRFNVNIPATPGKGLRLFCPAVVNQVWVWVNGQYAGRTNYMMPWFRPQELDMDITPFVKPGQPNNITLRVRCDEDYFGVNGLYERAFIYAKK